MVESVQKCLALTEMGSGLMNRIYFMKSKLVGEKRNIYMGPDYLHRFRVMITQNFPKVPSRKKLKEIPGGEAFASNAVNNCRVLSSYRDLVYDMVDFAVNSAAVLTSMPKTSVLHSHFERNREVVQCYLDLLKTYMRVMIFFSTMKEGKTLYALYAASVHYLHHSDEHSKRMSLGGHSIEKKYTENASTLFSHMEDTSRHFIDAFNVDLAQFLKSMLLNMRVTLWAGEDLYALEARKVFDPVNANFTKSSNDSDGAHDHDAEHKQIDRNVLDTQPVEMTLNTESTLDLYSELCSLQAYKESVVFACLAAPSLMLEPDILDLLRHVIEHTMVLPIFRDFNLMIHRTLEDLALAFPDPALDPLITVPKGYKLKTTLKHIARHATMTCAHYHVQRRTYLTAVLARVHSLIQQSPGLVGPKMPLITAVASLAREEVLWYYRHLGKVKIRKDCKKFHDPSLYVAYDIAELVGELCRLTTAVRQHQKIIINYYSEYLSGSHFKKLISLLETVSKQIDARLKDYPEGTGPLSDQDNKDELLHLKSIMNPMVEDLVRATTMFSQRPDFRAIHKITKENGNSSDAANTARESSEENGDANTGEGLDMHLYRMHPDDRALTKELRALATDPLGGAAGVGSTLLKHGGAMQPGSSDIPLITGDVERLGSLRRNWLAAEDHLNRALEILTLAQKDEQNNMKKSDASTVNTRRKDTLRALLSASKLITHMRVLVNHSMFVDSLPAVYEHYFEPHDVWWFRDSFVDSFYDCIEGDSEDGREAKFALAYMWIPSISARSLHADCPQEAAPMAKAAILVAETMIEDFLTHFGDQFHALCEKVDGLKQQVAPIEAGNRLERMLSAKEEEDAGGETRVAEPYPGFESHPDHKSSIHEHALIKGNVVHLIATANEFGQIQVHDRYYTLPSALVGRAADSIRVHFIPTFFSGFEHSDLNPISDAYRAHKSAIAAFKLITRYADLHESHERSEELYSGGGNEGGKHGTGRSKFLKGAGAMVPLTTMDGEGTTAGTAANSHDHHAAAGTTFDVGRWYRDLLFSQSSDPCVPFPGTHLPTDMKVGGVNLAWQYSIWFAGMASQIASGRSGLVYLPQVNAIGTLSVVKDVKTQYSVRQNRRKSQTQRHHRGSVETLAYDEDEEEEGEEKVAATSFLTVGEISSMCRLMGPHGIRIIDTQLLRIMTYMVNTDVRDFLAENEKPLRRLTTRCREKGVLRGVHKDLKGLHRLCDALTTIGFIVVLRRMLYQAQGEVLSSLSPSIADILKSVASVIDPLEAPRGGCAAAADIVSLAGAYGSTTAVDMPVLIALERQCFDPCPVFDKQRVKPAPTSVNFQGSYVSGGVGGGGRRASVISELSDTDSDRRTSVRVDVDSRDSHASERTRSMNKSMSSQMYSVSSASPKAFYRSLTSGAAGADGSGTKSTKYIDEWELMPAALASVYLSDLWEHTHYYSAHNAFSHNEHLLPEAISALLLSSMGCDGYAQYLHILKTEQENVAARAAELRSRNNNSPGKGSKGGDDGDGDSDDDESGGANTEVESRRASAATLASASAASIGSKLAKTAPTGEYIAAEHAVTNRSLIKDHLKAQTESFLCMTSNILLWVQGRGRLSAQRIMSDAMQSLGGEAETHHMTNNDCDTSAQDSEDLDGALFMGFSRKPVKKAEDATAAAVAAASAAAATADSRGGSAEEKSSGRGATSPPRPVASSSKDDGKKAGSGKSATTPSKKDGKSSGKGKSKKQDKEAGSDSEEDEDVEDKEGDLEDFSMRPVPAMASTLEKFVWLCPVASRSMLESYYPYSLIHTGLSEAALGKLRELDERRPYADKK